MADYLFYRKHLVSHHAAWEFTPPSVPPDDVIVEEPEQSIVRSLPDRAPGRPRTKAHHLWGGVIGARFHAILTTLDIAQSLPDRARPSPRASPSAYSITLAPPPPEEIHGLPVTRLPGQVPGRPRAATQAYAVLQPPQLVDEVGPEQDGQRWLPDRARSPQRTAPAAYTVINVPEVEIIGEPEGPGGKVVFSQPYIDVTLRRQQAYYRFYSSRGGGTDTHLMPPGSLVVPTEARGRPRAASPAYRVTLPVFAVPDEVYGTNVWSLPDRAPLGPPRAVRHAYVGQIGTVAVEFAAYPDELQRPVFPDTAPGQPRAGSDAYGMFTTFPVDDVEVEHLFHSRLSVPDRAPGRPRAALAAYQALQQWVRIPDELEATITSLPVVARGLVRTARTAYEVLFPAVSPEEEVQASSLSAVPTRAPGRQRATPPSYQIHVTFVEEDVAEVERLETHVAVTARAPGRLRAPVAVYWFGQLHTDLSAGTEGFPPFRVHFRRLSLEAVNAAQVSVLHTHEKFLTLVHEHARTVSVPPDHPQTIRERRHG